MLTPDVATPFPMTWGFSTRLDPDSDLPLKRLHQVHGTAVIEAPDHYPDADGLWTRTPGLQIGVQTADCVPILLAGMTPDGPWAAAIHSGWRGTVAGILREGVAVFTRLGGRPEDLVWALGPAILACHFEVGPEVVEAARKDPAWREDMALPGPNGRPHLDLHGLLRAQALAAGLDPGKDGSVAVCTYCSPELLYSYRRGEKRGRQWGWVRIGPMEP